LRLGKGSGVIKVTIALQPLTGNCADFIDSLHLGFGCGRDVNRNYTPCEHNVKSFLA
jgi:hypothetical protein